MMAEQEKIKQAVELLNQATTLIYNIEGETWQMAYDVLEAVLENLKIHQVIK